MNDPQERANQLRNIDEDQVCMPANQYFLGHTEGGALVIGLGLDKGMQVGLFLDRAMAVEFLDRFTSEMQAMGFLS